MLTGYAIAEKLSTAQVVTLRENPDSAYTETHGRTHHSGIN